MERRSIVLFVLMSFVLLGGVSAAQGGIIASESWDYGDGSATSVVGQTGGTGFENITGWQTNADATNIYKAEVLDPGTALSYTSGDSSISISGGNRALRLSEGVDLTYKQMVDRSLATALSAGTDPELFVSFLMRVGTGSLHNHDIFGVAANNTTSRGVAHYRNSQFITTPTTWGDVPGAVNQTPNYEQTYFIVSRFYADSLAANWDPTNPMYNRSEIWIDPDAGDAGSPEAIGLYTGAGSEKSRSLLGISSVTIVAERLDPVDAIWYDEYVIGTTWNDVIPEPMTLTLLAAGAVVLLRRRR